MRAYLTLVVACAAGCHETQALPAPDLTGAGSALVLYTSAGIPQRAELVDAAQGLPPFARDITPETVVTAVAYACAPAAYGLETGPLELLAEPRINLGLPSALSASSLRLAGAVDAEALAWASVDVTAEPLHTTLRRVDADVNLCPDMVVDELDFDPDPSITFLEATWIEAAVGLGDGRALVVTRHESGAGRVFLIDRRGDVTTSTLAYRGSDRATLPPGFVRRDVHGTLWHFSATSTRTPIHTIARGTLEGGLDVVATFDPPGSLTEVALLEPPEGGGPPAALLTLSQANSSGGVGSRVVEVPLVGEPRAVVEVDTREVVRRMLGNAPVLEVVSHEEFVVANATSFSRTFERYQRVDGAWMSAVEDLPEPLDAPMLESHTERTGDLVIDRLGRATLFNTWTIPRVDDLAFLGTGVVERRDGRWQRDDRAVFSDTLSAIAATRVDDGLTVVSGWADGGRADTRVALYQRGAGLCALESFGRPFGNTRVAPAAVTLDEDTILVLPGRTVGRAFLWRRTSRPPACANERSE
jgi:hypothetical protein